MSSDVTSSDRERGRPDALAERAAATDDFVGTAAPEHWRMRPFNLSMAWLAIGTGMFWMITASSTALVVGTVPALVGIVLAAIVYGLVGSLFARHAATTGESIAVAARRLLGPTGEIVVALLLAATGIYFAAFEVSAVAVASEAALGGLPLQAWYAVAVLVGLLLGIGGLRTWLDKLNGLLLPFYLVGLVAAVALAVADNGYSSAWLSLSGTGEVGGPHWVFALSVYLGQAVVLLFAWDYARLGRSQDVKVNARITFGAPFWAITFVLNGLIGIFLATTITLPDGVSETSVVLALLALMGGAGLAFIWVTQTRINTANIYVGSANLTLLLDLLLRCPVRRAVAVALMGAVVFVLTLSNVFGYLLDALRYQGAVVATFVAVVGVLLVRPGAGENRVAALGAWVVSSAVTIVLLAAFPSFGDTWALPIGVALAVALALAATTISGPSGAAGDKR